MAAPKRTIKQHYLGTHIIAELFGCKKLDDLKFISQSLKQAASICGATVLHIKVHRFSPQGITGYVLLAESHISIHTWPEHGYAAVDVFTCGLMDTEKAIEYLASQFVAEKIETYTIMRGKKEGSYVSPKLRVKNSPIEGKGLFAAEKIYKGEVMVDSTNAPGRFMSRETVEALDLKYEDFDLQVDWEVVLVKIDKDEIETGDFLNHSCDPNCGMRGDLQFVSMRNIEPGEEITYDYAMSDSYEYKMECVCRKENCRKVITGNDWKMEELQGKYNGFFSRYLQEEIDRQGVLQQLKKEDGVSSFSLETNHLPYRIRA